MTNFKAKGSPMRRIVNLIVASVFAVTGTIAVAPAAQAVDSVGVDVNPTELVYGSLDFGRRNLWPWIGDPAVTGPTGLTDGSPVIADNGSNYNFKAKWTGLNVPADGCLTDLRIKMTGAPRAAGWSLYYFNSAFDSISGEQATLRTTDEVIVGQDGPGADKTAVIFQYRSAPPGFGFGAWGGSGWPPITPDTTEYHTVVVPLSTENITAADLAAGNFYATITSFGWNPTSSTADELTALKLSYTVTSEPCEVPLPARITQVSPAEGGIVGGTNITITGSGFQNGTSIKVGGTPCTNVVKVSSTEMTCTTPVNTTGSKDIELFDDEDTRYVSAKKGFYYVEVVPENITVTADDKSITLGDAFPAFTTNQDANVTGMTCAVYASSDTGYATPLTSADVTVAGSPYVIRCSGATANAGYAISGYENGELTVTSEPTDNGGGADNGSSATCKSVPLKVIFKGDSSKLTKKAKKALRGYAKKVAKSGCTTIVLNGFTAKFTGTKEKPVRKLLSKKRNAAVKSYLSKQLKALDYDVTFKTSANGGKKPVVSNSNKDKRWKNRRVEIVLKKVVF